MAKKEKVELTPEELEAKKARKKEKRGIFGKTFTKVLAWMLAIVLVYAVTYLAFGKPTPTVQVSGGATQQLNNNNTSKDQWDTTPSGTGDNAQSGGDNAQSGGGDNSQGGGTASADNDAAVVVKAINDATAAAANAKASYDWERVGKYNEGGDIKVTTSNGKDATSTLDSAIKFIDKNSSIDSVVGGFLGIGEKSAKMASGATEAEGMDANYTLKPTALTANDIKIVSAKDGVYSIKIADSSNPQRDNATALAKLTQDFLTKDEVSEAISGVAGSVISLASGSVDYKNISAVITVKDGKLTDFTYTYQLDATLDLAIKFLFVNTSLNGTGQGTITAHYSNISY